MRRKRGASIRMRLTLSHLAVIVVAMGLSGLLLLSLLERYFLQAMEDGLAAQAQITAQALIPGATALGTPAESPSAAYNTVQQQWSNLALEAQNVAPPEPGTSAGLDLDYLADATLQLSTQLETRIRIVDAQGIVRVDSSGGDVGVDLATDPLVNQALAGQRANRVDRESPPAMRLALPMEVEGQLVGAVYLSQPLRDALAVIGDLRTLWLLSTLAALLLSAGVGLALSGAITRPLRRLTAAAAAVARGDLGQKVPVRSRDEVGRLPRAAHPAHGGQRHHRDAARWCGGRSSGTGSLSRDGGRRDGPADPPGK
jgi:two-component system sensor histidine kinase VicK